MREIIFRAKSIDSGEWVQGDLLQYAGTAQIWCETDNGKWNCLVDPATVGQYTGMTDRNGKKIFEGDVVLKRTYNGKRAFPVTFTDGMFHAGWGGGSSTATHAYTLDDRQIEVIGNRWDNLELWEED